MPHADGHYDAPMRTSTRRRAELRAILEARRQQLTDGVHGMMRDVRERNGDDRDVVDTHDGADIDVQADLDLALIQMKAETLGRIDAALRRLDADAYGHCVECAGTISGERLGALPFAVRCTSCEDAREQRARTAGLGRARRARADISLDAAD